MTFDFEVHPAGTASAIDRLRKAARAMRDAIRTVVPGTVAVELSESGAWIEFCAAIDAANNMGANDADPS